MLEFFLDAFLDDRERGLLLGAQLFGGDRRRRRHERREDKNDGCVTHVMPRSINGVQRPALYRAAGFKRPLRRWKTHEVGLAPTALLKQPADEPAACYSITLPARTQELVSGIAEPERLGGFRVSTTSSKVVGCSTGRSPGSGAAEDFLRAAALLADRGSSRRGPYPIRHSFFRHFRPLVDRRQSLRYGPFDDDAPIEGEHGRRQDVQCGGARRLGLIDGWRDLVQSFRL